MKNSKKEIWRDIPDYENYYQVSNLGRVRSLDRTIINSLGRKQFYKGRFFKDSLNVHGYKQVSLSKDGKRKTFLIHQLVAVCFLGHTPNGHTLVVDHINGVKTDNRTENLQIVTNRDNTTTCYRANEDSLTSDFAGVSFSKTHKKWRADIQVNNEKIFLGLFDNELEASYTYQKALDEINNNNFNPEYYKPSFTSNFKGIYFNKASQKWMCQPYINGRQIYLGRFENEEEAFQMILLYESAQPIKKL